MICDGFVVFGNDFWRLGVMGSGVVDGGLWDGEVRDEDVWVCGAESNSNLACGFDWKFVMDLWEEC